MIRRFVLISTMAIVTAFLSAATLAQASMSSWAFFADITPNATQTGIFQSTLTLDVLDKGRQDLADLRLLDANGREVPYALVVRRDVDERRAIETRLFNSVTLGGKASEVAVDLGENQEHNEVEIETSGSNFRRRVDLEGSDTASDWRTLQTDGVIFRFESANKIVASNRLTYPLSRYRYLRVRVHADELTDKEAPSITGVRAMMVTREREILSTWRVTLPPNQLLRNQGAPASAWTIDLGGRIPCDRLSLNIEDESFSRPFEVEIADDPQNSTLIASGELTRRRNEKPEPLTIRFDNEVYARKLRLLITDYNNPTLSISSIDAAAPAREIYFELKDRPLLPLRLFFGNAKATAPHYDFEKELPSRLTSPPFTARVGTTAGNPSFTPEPLPLTERIPWLIYVVLTISAVALALILLSLARATMRMKPKTSDKTSTAGTITS